LKGFTLIYKDGYTVYAKIIQQPEKTIAITFHGGIIFLPF
jgi:hypothetical protein